MPGIYHPDPDNRKRALAAGCTGDVKNPLILDTIMEEIHKFDRKLNNITTEGYV
jgi:hypothetical protein